MLFRTRLATPTLTWATASLLGLAFPIGQEDLGEFRLFPHPRAIPVEYIEWDDENDRQESQQSRWPFERRRVSHVAIHCLVLADDGRLDGILTWH